MPETEPVYYPNSNVVFTRLDDREAVLLSLDTKRYYSLNETGARLWELLQEGATTAVVCAKLLREYEADPSEAGRFIRDFLEDLRREGILESR